MRVKADDWKGGVRGGMDRRRKATFAKKTDSPHRVRKRKKIKSLAVLSAEETAGSMGCHQIQSVADPGARCGHSMSRKGTSKPHSPASAAGPAAGPADTYTSTYTLCLYLNMRTSAAVFHSRQLQVYHHCRAPHCAYCR